MAKISAAKRDEIEKRAAEKFGTAAVEQARQRQQQAVKDANQKYIDLKARQAAENARLTDQQKVERALRSTGSTVTGQATAPAASHRQGTQSAAPTVGVTNPADTPISTAPAATHRQGTVTAARAGSGSDDMSKAHEKSNQVFEAIVDYLGQGSEDVGKFAGSSWTDQELLRMSNDSYLPWVRDAWEDAGFDTEAVRDEIASVDRQGEEYQRVASAPAYYTGSFAGGLLQTAENYYNALWDVLDGDNPENRSTAARAYSAGLDEKYGIESDLARLGGGVAGLAGQVAATRGMGKVLGSGLAAAGVTGEKAANILSSFLNFANSSQGMKSQALEAGATLEDANAAAIAAGTASTMLDRLFGMAMPTVKGETGMLDKAVGKMMGKLFKNEATRSIVTAAFGLGMESLEEGADEIVENAITLIYDKEASTGKPLADIRNKMVEALPEAGSAVLTTLLFGMVSDIGNMDADITVEDVAQEMVANDILPADKVYNADGTPTDTVVEMHAAIKEGQKAIAAQKLDGNSDAQQLSGNVAQQPASEPVKPAVTPQPAEQETTLQQAVKPAQSESGFSPEEQAQLDVLLPKQLDNKQREEDNRIKQEEVINGQEADESVDAMGGILRSADRSGRDYTAHGMEGQGVLPRSGDMVAENVGVSNRDTRGTGGRFAESVSTRETAGEFDARMAAAGKQIIKAGNRVYAYSPAKIETKKAKRAKELLLRFGVPNVFVFDGSLNYNANGETVEHKTAQSGLLDDSETVAVSNNLKLPAEMAAFHEAVHYYLKRRIPQVLLLVEQVEEQGLDYKNPLAVDWFTDIADNYRNMEQAIIDNSRGSHEEMAAQIAGDFYFNEAAAVAKYGAIFSDVDSIIKAFHSAKDYIENVNAPAEAEAFSDAQTPEDGMFSHFEQQLQADEDAKRAADQARQQDVQQLAEAINPDSAVFREAPKGKVVGKVDGVDVYASDLSGDAKYTGVKMLGNKLGRQVVIVKSLPHNADGAWANGTIYISENVADGKLLHTLLKHELTHSLRGAKLWNKFEAYTLQQFEAREGSEKFYALREKLASDYAQEGVPLTEAQLREELAANYVQKYLFRDQRAVNDLVKANRSAAQRIWHTLRDAALSFAGKLTPEQQAIRKAERMFAQALAQTGANAYRENGNAKSDALYSLESIDGINYVRTEKNNFLKEDGALASEKEVFDSLVGSIIPLPDGDVRIVAHLPGKRMYKELFNRRPGYVKDVKSSKQLNSDVNYNMRELIANSELISANEPDVDNRHQAQGITSFDTRRVKFYDGENAYDVELSVGILQNGEKVAYAKKFFGFDPELTKKIQDAESLGFTHTQKIQHPVSNGKIPQIGADVNNDSQNLSASDANVDYSILEPQADELAYDGPTDEEFTQWVEESIGAKDPSENAEVKELLTEDGRLYLSDARVDTEMAQALSNAHAFNLNADTLPRVLDRVAGGNARVRSWLRDFIETPLNTGKGGWARDVQKQQNALAAIVKETGIYAGTPESAAVQWYGEGRRTVGEKVKPYTLQDLQREFPDSWQKIVKMERWCRQTYDGYVDRLNDALTRIYPNAERTEQLKLDKLLAQRAVLERERERLQNLFDYDQIAFADLESARAGIEADLRALDIKVEEQQQKLISGDYLVGKRLKKRADYFHHFQDISKQGLAGNLRNLFKQSRATAIDPALVTVSEFTKPKTNWTGMLQRRSGERTDADAVMGMALYIPQAEYVVHIDPVIAHMRNVVSDLVQATKQTRNANDLISYLTEFTNQLAGKTPSMDRSFIHTFGDQTGRELLSKVAAFNNRVKANKVVLNARSALSQALNLPHAVSLVKSPKAWAKALQQYGNLKDRAGVSELLAQSDFLLERYLNTDAEQFKAASAASKFSDFSNWMMSVGDRAVAELTWLAAYNEALEQQSTAPQGAEESGNGERMMLGYTDTEAQQKAQADKQLDMVQRGKYVELTEADLEALAEYYPDLRHIKKKDRTPLLKQKKEELLQIMHEFLEKTFKGEAFTFEINGDTIEATVHQAGIDEAVKRLSRESAAMLRKTRELFGKAEYIFSTPTDIEVNHAEKSSNSDIKQWDYFYVPLKMGDTYIGVRIAARNLKTGDRHEVYHWGIKKSPSLDNGRAVDMTTQTRVSSDGDFNTTIPETGSGVKKQDMQRAAQYADDLTRRAVGGRGIGEIPPTMKNKVVDLIMPFQLEVNNSWQSVKGMVREHDYGALLRLVVGSFLMNELYSALFGYEGLPDILGPVLDGIRRAFDDEEEESAGEILGDTARNVAGNVVAAMPGASALAPLVFGIGEDEGEALFGDASPTRYGTGLTGLSEVTGLAADLFSNGTDADLVSPLLNILLPKGGAQVGRLYHGAQDLGWLPDGGVLGTPFGGERHEVAGSYTDSGRLRFLLDDSDISDVLQTLLIGPYTTEQGQQYLETLQPYSESVTQKMLTAQQQGIDPQLFLEAYDAQRAAEYEKGVNLAKSTAQKAAVDEAAQGLTEEELQLLYELFGISEKVW